MNINLINYLVPSVSFNLENCELMCTFSVALNILSVHFNSKIAKTIKVWVMYFAGPKQAIWATISSKVVHHSIIHIYVRALIIHKSDEKYNRLIIPQ